MQASRRRTPNTKCVTPARWGNRGAEHGAEKDHRFTDAASMRRHWKSNLKKTMPMKKKIPTTTKTAAISIRISPRMKHLIDIMTRDQRRSLTAVIETAVEALATERQRQLANDTWSTDEEQTLLSLYRLAPHLCSFDEEKYARAAIAAEKG